MAQQIDIVANLLMKVDGAEAGINKLKSSLSKLKMPEGLENSFKKSFANLDTIFARYRSQVEKGFDTKGDVTAFNKTSKALDAELTRLSKHFTELTGKEVNFKVKSDDIIRTEKELERLIEQKNQLSKESLKFEIKGGKDGVKDIETLLQRLQSAAGKTKTGEYANNALEFLKVGNIQAAVTQLDKAAASFKRLKQEKQDAFKDTGFDMGGAIAAIIAALTGVEGKFGNVNTKIEEVKNNLTNFQAEQIQDAADYADELSNKFAKDETAIRQADGAMQEFARSSQSMSQQLSDLQQSTQYFFSLRNMINLLKRGIDDAIQSVKELDAAMTDTAVVTDYKVSDLWGMLPQYTQLANQLGATTQGAYETMTLYFQQGLDQQAAFEIGAETMKMARIAGLEYAETTDMMTAALRGFNMELNETSAKRVNDVYSELAAITASDTEELGKAMQRTASIAHSAGASFEGTTAFLAQAIETTREPAENIGTAMKTIVARFQEMKKNPLEISEVDGEEVDFNKIDAALKTIGVDLTDTNGQFREFDQVMLDISAKWDSLSQSQQRYIATIAAGSRQQSRFIAMVSNYDRTMQLMEAANNSAGASDEQFGKTMDSLESKLNKLHNAWQQFTMGIANNGMIKLAVDGATGILNVINKLIDTVSLGIGPVKSLLSLFTAFTGLKALGLFANKAIGGLGGLIDPQSSFKQGFKSGIIKQGPNTAQAQAISNPIVQAIHQLQQALTGKGTVNQNNGSAGFETFKEANNNLRAFLQGEGKNSFTIADAYNKIDKLDNRQQAAILGQLPGLTLSLKKNGIQFDTQGIKKESAELIQSFNKEINQGLKNNTISTQNALQIFGTPENFKQAMEARGPEYAKAASEVFFNQDYYQQQYEKYWKDLNIDENFLGHLGSEEALEARTAELQEQAKHKATIDAENKALEEFSQRAKVTQTSGAQIANSFGNIGNYAMIAGQGVAQLGMQLSNAGFESAGAAITNLGYQISSLGQIASSVGSLVGKISGAGGIGALIAAHPAIAGLTATVLALGGAFALVQHNIQKTKKAGEEVVKNFTETNKETTDNIAKLKSYQGELASLSQGVDVNGNNINLDDSQYQRYLEIVDDIAAINPDIVQGYNAQGHAIIDNNQALEDTLQLQQEIQKQAYKTYLSTNSLQTLINARNVNADYRKATKNFGSSKAEDSGKLNPNNAPLAKDVRNLAKDLRFNAGFDASILKKYGIDSLDALMSGEEEAVRKFVKNQDKIQQELTNAGVEMGEDVLEGFQTLGEDTQAFDEAIKPVYDNLLASISNSSMYKDLAPEMQSALAEGLKDIAGQNLDANEMESAAKALTLRFQDAFDKAEEPLSRADDALEKFTQDLDEAAYKETASDIAEELRDLAKEAEAVGQVEIAEWYENQASRIENALTNTTYSIAEGIDTLSDNIAKAKASFDSLAEGIDDYYTLSDKAKGLVDTALEDKNTGGNGSKTFWRTYQGLASEEAFNRHDKDEAVANMKQFQKYFAEGSEGATAFVQKLIDSQTDSFKFTEATGKETTKQVKDFFELAEDGTLQIGKDFKNLSDEQYSQLAAAFDLSDDGFTAVLNNLRQWGDLDFADPGLIRKALAVDDRSITTNKKVSVEGQEGKVSRLYYGQSVLDAEMADKSEEERKNTVRDLEVQGSIRLPSGAEKLIKAPSKIDNTDEGGLLKQFVDDTKGTSNQMQNVMAALIKSGEYTKEDLGKVHQAILDQNLLAGATDIDKSFDDIYSNAELEVTDPATEIANEHLSTISATVSTIAGIVAAGKINEGYLPDAAKQSGNLYNDLVGQKGKADTWAQLFSKGIDIEGNGVITADKFTEYSNRLQSYAQKNDEYIAALKEGRNATTDPTKIAEYDAEIKAAETNAKIIAQLLNDAGIHFAQTQTDFSNAVNSVSSKLIEIGNNPNLTQTEQKTLTAGALTDFAKKLDSLNFSPEQIQSVFKDNFGIELELKNGDFATEIGSQIQEQLNNLGETEINAILNISSISMPAAAKGKNNTPSAIRRVGTMARGSKKHGYIIDGEPTLTGELGPELVWEPKQNSAYMVGENGPQFTNLSKNAVVWNAQQTKKIKANSKGVRSLGTGARGIHNFGTMAGGTTLPGTFNIDANANILEVTPPTPMPEVDVKANLEVEGNTGGGFLSKLFGGKEGPSIDVAANVTSINTNSIQQTIPVIGNITKLNTETTANNIKATATVTQVVKSGQIAGEPISVKATATATKVQNQVPQQTVSAGTQTMKVTADTGAAQAKINQLINLFNKTYTLKYQASGPRSISVPISANFVGSWRKTVEINKSGANGINNFIKNYSTPNFGSMAKGPFGQLGPKGKGGLTLTGEKGFEIAWLPSENRSMVLGVNGPQMLNLPADAVVYTHEQSKKILKQKAIPAGSHATTSARGNDIAGALGIIRRGTGSSGSGTAKTVKKTSKAVQKSAEDAGKAVGKVSVWWENIARKTEVAQRKMDKSQKAFENYIKEMRSTLKTTGQSLKSGGGGGDAYIKNIGKYIGYYQAQLNKANKELKTLNTGKGGTQKQMKANYGGDGHENIAQISYKKGKKSKEEYVNLASYIKAENGTYVVDQKKLNKEKNTEKRKAIADAANKEINDRLSKKYKAEDEIEKANEALKKMGEELYETFFKWENELTKIWNITQKIEQAQSRISRNDAYGDLLNAQLSTGELKGGKSSAKKDLANFRSKLKTQNQLLQNRQQAITESKNALQHILTSDEEKTTLASVNSKLSADKQATKKANKKAELDKAKKAKADYDNAVKNKKTTQNKLDKVQAKINKLNKKTKLSKSEKKELKNLKEQRDNLKKQITNYDKTIKTNKSLAGQVNKLQTEYNKMASGTALNATQRAGYEQYKKELEDQIAAEELGRKYTTITKRADGTIDVQFNTEAFEKARLNGNITSDMAKAVQDWVKSLQEASANLQENYENLIKDVTEYYTQLESLQDEWANYGKELTEISEAAEKEKIDKIKQLYDGIKKALDKLLDDVKRKLDERRKQEENAQTERDISQKQQRLAALRADTSGGHQVEIAQLEKEIAEAQQNYQNSLEDQLLDKLQQQADLAAEQRERQIELQEALASSVNNIEKVNEWMTRVNDPNLTEKQAEALKEEIRAAYYSKNNYDNVTNAEQEDIERDFNEFYNGLLTNQTKQEELNTAIDSIKGTIEQIEKYLLQQNQTLETAKADGYTAKQAQSQFGASLSELRTVGKYTFDDFIKAGYSKAQIKQAGFAASVFKSKGVSYADAKAAGYSLDELEKAGYSEATKEKANIAAEKAAAAEHAKKVAAEKAAAAEQDKKRKALNTYNTTLDAAYQKGTVTAAQLKTLFSAGDTLKYSRLKVMSSLASGDKGGGVTWKEVLQAAKSAGYSGKTIKGYLGSNPTATRKKAFEAVFGKWSKFATGGIADFTGPAWLDGTPSKPELVLDAQDTKNFIALKDVLSHAMSSTNQVENSYGGNAIYEININVDHLNNDYDVDRVVERVKKKIVQDSGYRNVTQVRKFR